jgi:peroxiredoxin
MKHTIIATLAGIVTLACAQAIEIGKAAPAFSAKNVKGETVSLADHAGKVVVLEWTNLSCPFVRKHYDSGNMQKLQESAAAKGVIWLTVNSSAEGKQGFCSPEKMADCIQKEGIKSANVLLDSSGEVGKAYDAKVTPHMFIINKDGTLAYDGAVDSKSSTDKADVATAEPLFANALDAVLAGKAVTNAKNKPYGCGVKYVSQH